LAASFRVMVFFADTAAGSAIASRPKTRNPSGKLDRATRHRNPPTPPRKSHGSARPAHEDYLNSPNRSAVPALAARSASSALQISNPDKFVAV
jgi:hypothetical protein